VVELQTCNRIVVVNGDISKENFGLDDQTVSGLQKRVSIFIHASSGDIFHDGLPEVVRSVVYPSLVAAQLALGFAHLERFVFVSTAYANGFLHWDEISPNATRRQECVVEEHIHPLRKPEQSVTVELNNIVDFGMTPEHDHMNHLCTYSYGNHLAERLLLEAFQRGNREDQLLIFRPSCIAPAQQEPFLHSEVAGSSPFTAAMCEILSCLPKEARCYSNLAEPSHSTIDEVPIDVVVNRLVAHIAFGTSGCVHAVGGASGRRSFPDMFNAAANLRRWWWWHPTLQWCEDGTDPRKICSLSKRHKLVGCSYLFREEKTERIWQLMGPSMREKWPLWTTRDPSDMSDLPIRAQTSGEMLSARLERKYGRYGRWMAKAMGPKYQSTMLTARGDFQS